MVGCSIREYLVTAGATSGAPDVGYLIALALDHRIRAERATNPTEQCENHRIADIYEVLATLDLPLSDFAEMVCPSDHEE